MKVLKSDNNKKFLATDIQPAVLSALRCHIAIPGSSSEVLLKWQNLFIDLALAFTFIFELLHADKLLWNILIDVWLCFLNLFGILV